METTIKPIWQSKTFYFNVLSALISVVLLINTDMLSGFGVTPENQVVVLKVTASIVAVINIALRFITTSPVSINGK